jgi:hypothetical protein
MIHLLTEGYSPLQGLAPHDVNTSDGFHIKDQTCCRMNRKSDRLNFIRSGVCPGSSPRAVPFGTCTPLLAGDPFAPADGLGQIKNGFLLRSMTTSLGLVAGEDAMTAGSSTPFSLCRR